MPTFDARAYNIDDLMNMPSNELPEPPEDLVLPEGWYRGIVMAASIGDSPFNPGKFQALSVSIGLTGPGPDVKLPPDVDVTELQFRPRTWELTPTLVVGTLRRILDSMGIDPTLSPSARISEMQGKEVLVEVIQKPATRPNADGRKKIFNNFGMVLGIAAPEKAK